MDNFLDSGAVLPFGLLGSFPNASAVAGFNRSYKNTALKAGIVIQSYPVSDAKNITGLCTEYDVLVIEQNMDQGATSILYKNCLSSQGLGSIADYFETALRPMETQTNKGSLTFKGQDGAVVLLLCLDGLGEKGIVMGALNHPDRTTNLDTANPKLAGEYNGVQIMVNEDGSCSLIFKGATDNQGMPTDSTQGNTTLKIETDGSFQVDNDAITFRLDKTAQNASLEAKKDISLTAQGNINLTATGNLAIQCADVTVKASGKADITTGADAKIDIGGNCELTVSETAKVTATAINLNGKTGMVLTNITDPVVDFITGVPTMGVETVTAG